MWAHDFREFFAHRGGEGRATISECKVHLVQRSRVYIVLQFPMLNKKHTKSNVFSETQGILLAISVLKSNTKYVLPIFYCRNILILKWRNGIEQEHIGPNQERLQFLMSIIKFCKSVSSI